MSHDPLAGLLRSFNLTTMASIYADTLAQAEQNHWGYRKFLLFIPTFKLVQKLLLAKKALKLEGLLKKLDRYAVVALDDIGYVQQDREEMEVLFTFLAERYERRSVMITSNLVFSKWDQIFKDPMTTMAAIDRLVHHSTILEFDGESVRAKKAKSWQSA